MNLLAQYADTLPDLTQRLETALQQRGLKTPVRYILHQSAHGDHWLFAVMDGQDLGKLERYTAPNTVHQIQTYLEGRHVGLSNSSGLRYCVLLSPKKEIPAKVDFPGNDPTRVLLGEDRYGAVARGWARFGHWAIGGMTDFGKSNLLNLIALQCLGIGGKVAVLDMENRTFPQFKYAPQKYLFAADEQACAEGIDHLWEEYLARKHAFDKLEQGKTRYFPDNIFAYNALVPDPLPPLFVFIDEFVTLRKAIPDETVTRLESLTRLTRKYGIHFVFSGQTWNKSETGTIRDQCHIRLALKTADYYQSIGIVGRPGAEQIELPGRVLSNTFGEFQTYYVAPHLLDRALKLEQVSQNEFSREEEATIPLRTSTEPVRNQLEEVFLPPQNQSEPVRTTPHPLLQNQFLSLDEKITLMLDWGVSINSIINTFKDELRFSREKQLEYVNNLRLK